MSDRGGTISGAGKLLRFAAKDLKKPRGESSSGYEGVPRLSWDRFLQWFTWRQGEHVTLLGTTGSGKTTAALELLPRRDYVIAFGTKRKDDTLDKLLRGGEFQRIESWPPPRDPRTNKFVLWPDIAKVENPREVPRFQSEIFGEALAGIYQQEGWCLFVDELQYCTETLKLDSEIKVLYQQGRSVGISILAGTQRPRHVPLVAYDQATHIFFWRENDEENLKRMAGIGYARRDEVLKIVSTLDHVPGKGGDFLYVNTRTGEMAISKVEL